MRNQALRIKQQKSFYSSETPYGVSSLANGLVAGYSTDGINNDLTIKNITMNDDRSGTWYLCDTKIR